jgi:DNA-directed RNA polymerase subunit RPC12/RpoP
MALAICPECKKDVSDKAYSCPHCGCPINQQLIQQEEFLCCPYCFSRELHSEHKGFSGGKALAGVMVAGGIGLLAGTIGSRDTQITCLKCGKKFKAGEAKIVK